MKIITFCTVCMNRLQYLKETYPENLEENKNNPNIEFLLLNYNSRDDMEEWAKETLGEYLESGLLKYYRTYDPEYFHLAHSKNMALRLATGEFLGLIDADNFTGPGYVDWVLEQINTHGPNIVTTTLRKTAIPYRDQGGKLCFPRQLFYSINGLDEELIGYGMDDVDLANRLENAGAKRVFIEKEHHLLYIGHSHDERLKNYRYPNLLQDIFLQDREAGTNDPARFLYLFKDQRFSEMYYTFKEELKTNLTESFGGWTTERGQGRKDGNFLRKPDRLLLNYDDGSTCTFREEPAGLYVLQQTTLQSYWQALPKDSDAYQEAVFGYCECQNRLKYVENDNNFYPVNAKGWGQGTVYLNFDRSNPIRLQ